MDSRSKIGIATSPIKGRTSRSRLNESFRCSENLNPNVASPGLKLSNSPLITKSDKSAKKPVFVNTNSNQVVSPKKKIRERKFVIAKKKSRSEEMNSSTSAVVCEKCKAIGKSKCLCVAYESLRASQEEFFRSPAETGDEVFDKLKEFDKVNENEVIKPDADKGFKGKVEGQDVLLDISREDKDDVDEVEVNDDVGVKRSRDRMLEEARENVPIPGPGLVMHLVKEFEKLSMLKMRDSEEKDVEEVKGDREGTKWQFTGLEKPPKVSEIQVSSSSFCPSDFLLTSESLGLDSNHSYSLDSSRGSFSISNTTSAIGQRSRRSSTESTGDRTRQHWKKRRQKATSQKPFMLRTEERGRCKEEEFMKKLQQIIEKEEKLRIPIAQGLPWTTDEPECLVKPPVKDNTRPIDLVLHSDMRAVERSEFDHQVAEKMDLIEQYRMERERLQKLAEEEEIRRLRKVLVPKAQPMPYFDRPFIPRRSMKQRTIPKEPKFHVPQHKKIKCYMSSDDDFYYNRSE